MITGSGPTTGATLTCRLPGTGPAEARPIAPCKRRTACSLPSTPAAIRRPRSGVRSARECTPEPVTVPTGATSVSIQASGNWGNDSGHGLQGGPNGYTGTPQTLETPSDYLNSAMNSQNITAGSFLEGTLVGTWSPDCQRAALTVGDAEAVAGDEEQFTVTLAPPPMRPRTGPTQSTTPRRTGRLWRGRITRRPAAV